MVASSSLAKRVAQLEQEVALLKKQQAVPDSDTPNNPWVDKIFGTFANDPMFEEAMQLGREYSKSLDRKPKKRKPGKNGHTRH